MNPVPQDRLWQTLREAALKQCQLGDAAEAERQFLAAVLEAERQGPGDPRLAVIHHLRARMRKPCPSTGPSPATRGAGSGPGSPGRAGVPAELQLIHGREQS
jgi:hypothetical protein